MFNQEWSDLKMSNIVLSVTILLTIVLMLIFSAGCGEATTVLNTSGRITMTSRYCSTNSFGKTAPTNAATGTMRIDSIRITRARLILREITYKTRSDSSKFRAEPIVLELNLSSEIQNISMSEIQFGSYDKIEFDVHRIETNDINLLPRSERGQFQNFAAGERYSIIISGKIYIGGQSIVFTFRSRVSAKQKIVLLTKIDITESSPEVNATMLINSGGWFRSSLGILLDPFDVLNESVISDNVFASIIVFEDNSSDAN